MAITPLYKVTLCGAAGEKAALVLALQHLGCLHLRSLHETPKVPEVLTPTLVARAKTAVKYLAASPTRYAPLQHFDPAEAETVITAVIHNHDGMRAAQDEIETLEARLKDLTPWGEFTPPTADELGGIRLWFYTVPLKALSKISKNYVFQEIRRDHRQAYLVVLAPEALDLADWPYPRVEPGDQSISACHKALEAARVRVEDAQQERQRLTRYLPLLTRLMGRFEDKVARRQAFDNGRDEKGFFILQGWVPQPLRDVVQAFAKEYTLAVTFEDPLPGEAVPTLLTHPKPLQAGEDLTTFYQTPAYGGADPSTVLFFSFPLFFAMIMADAGYGLVLTLLLALSWNKPKIARFRTLLGFLCACTVGYGVLSGNYFGLAPPAGSILASLNILTIDDVSSMMRLSILIGCGHVVLALVLQALHRPPLVPLGWVVAVMAGVVLWLHGSGPLGFGLLGTALFMVFIGSATQKGGFKALSGIIALTNITKLFGDVMSYMRLFALGLAGSSLAITFNNLASGVHESQPGTGVLWAGLILLLGHTLNLGLSIMAGVVHGLRLNYIEFFNWGMPEEGFRFAPFRLKETAL
jgi:V/A-type H+-transporting ATPase subunit I